MEQDTTTEVADGDYVTFRAAGQQAVGEFRCSECGYGVSVYRALPRCPMCSGTVWEESAARVWR